MQESQGIDWSQQDMIMLVKMRQNNRRINLSPAAEKLSQRLLRIEINRRTGEHQKHQLRVVFEPR